MTANQKIIKDGLRVGWYRYFIIFFFVISEDGSSKHVFGKLGKNHMWTVVSINVSFVYI